jgi:GT2 family glycosyltransferase
MVHCWSGDSTVRVDLVVPAYNQPAWIERLVASAASNLHHVVVHLFLHSTNQDTVRVCERLAATPHIRVRPYGENRGLSRTWNEGLLDAYGDGADVVVIANDDITLGPGDLDRIAAKAVAHRDRYIVSCAGFHERYQRRLPSHGYSCFAVNPIALEMLGCFDENFSPAYCEDQDYARRAGLAGLAEENCADTEVVHGGSSAIFASEELQRQNARTQALNMAYYARKWGGLAGEESFTTPFGNRSFGLRIAPEDRASPYGVGFDREDLVRAAV